MLGFEIILLMIGDHPADDRGDIIVLTLSFV